jgi:hypothetical protein
VPFGAFGEVGAAGFAVGASSFSPAPAQTIQQLTAAGKTSFSAVLQTPAPIETFTVGGATFRIFAAAIDTSNDGVPNYDTQRDLLQKCDRPGASEAATAITKMQYRAEEPATIRRVRTADRCGDLGRCPHR